MTAPTIYDGALTAAIFLLFLRRLVKDTGRKLFLIVDNLRVHRPRIVMNWVAPQADRIALFYLPPYAPERHPDELANNDLEQAMRRRRTPMGKICDGGWVDIAYARTAASAGEGARSFRLRTRATLLDEKRDIYFLDESLT